MYQSAKMCTCALRVSGDGNAFPFRPLVYWQRKHVRVPSVHFAVTGQRSHLSCGCLCDGPAFPSHSNPTAKPLPLRPILTGQFTIFCVGLLASLNVSSRQRRGYLCVSLLMWDVETFCNPLQTSVSFASYSRLPFQKADLKL